MAGKQKPKTHTSESNDKRRNKKASKKNPKKFDPVKRKLVPAK